MKVIDVQNVFLKYPSAKSDTIRGISFAVQQGEIFGFVNGRVGKSRGSQYDMESSVPCLYIAKPVAGQGTVTQGCGITPESAEKK